MDSGRTVAGKELRQRELLTVLQRATQSEHGMQTTARATVLLDHLVAAHAATLATAMVAVIIDTQNMANVLSHGVFPGPRFEGVGYA